MEEEKRKKNEEHGEMAMNATTIFPRILKALRENSNVKEKREALTYISRYRITYLTGDEKVMAIISAFDIAKWMTATRNEPARMSNLLQRQINVN